MPFKLAIADRVAVAVKGKLPGATRGTHVNFDFTLDMERIDQAQIAAAHTSDEAISDFLLSKTRAWERQQLVLNEDGSAAAFSEEAFRALLNVPGMALWVHQAYLDHLRVQEKN